MFRAAVFTVGKSETSKKRGVLDLFERAKVRCIVMEAVLGACKECTVVVDACVAVVTKEHAEIIGPTRENAAYEKASIVCPGGN